VLAKLKYQFDFRKLYSIYQEVRHFGNQINIQSRDGKTYCYDHGDYETRLKDNLEQEQFKILNDWFKDTYVEEVVNTFKRDYGICRARFMTMPKEFRAYSMHYDCAPRIHIPLSTNEDCMFIVGEELFKPQQLGAAYYIDTTHKHAALNLGDSDRTHMVFCLTRHFE